jgi:hypothetical protein
MSDRRVGMDRGSRLQLWAVLLVTLLVMVAGILVVAFPGPMGVPRPTPTALATPAATPAP